MKTLNVKQIFMSGIVAIMATALIVGCDDGDKKRATTTPGGGIDRTCVGCSAQTDMLLSGLGNTSYSTTAQIALDFFATTQVDNQTTNYTGPVEAGGWLFVENGTTLGCTVPRGDYQLRMVTGGQGQMDYSGIISGVRMEGVYGGDRIFLRVNYFSFIQAIPNLVSCRNELYSSEILGEIILESVNEIPCYNSVIYFNNRQAQACQ